MYDIKFLEFRGKMYAYRDINFLLFPTSIELLEEIKRKPCSDEEAERLWRYDSFYTLDELFTLSDEQLEALWEERFRKYVLGQ